MEVITNYTAEEEQLVIQSALNKKQLKLYDDKVLHKHFMLRKDSIEQYFLRSSYFHKTQIIMKFVEKLNSPANTFQILSNMSLSHIKMNSYSAVDPQTDNIHHKLTWDHDRMLEKDVLRETTECDIEWFQTLDDDKQFKLLMSLIELCSGSIKRSLYLPLYRIYSKNLADYMNSNFIGRASTTTVRKLEFPSDPTIDDPEFDPKHPSTIEVLKQRKKWYDLIEKYKSEVMPELPNTSGLKPNKAKQKTTTAKANQAQIDCEVDLIQLLPIWIVKQIFGYFSSTELLNLKKVNSYWSFVAQEIIKERKAREKIDQYLEKMKANIDPKIFSEPTATTLETKTKTGHKNLAPHYELASLDPKLVPKDLKKLCNVSLSTQAKAERRSIYDLKSGDMLPFPRIIKKGLELYKFRPSPLQDVGVRFEIDEEIERQKSLMTYSLASVVSSMKISVCEDDLKDW